MEPNSDEWRRGVWSDEQLPIGRPARSRPRPRRGEPARSSRSIRSECRGGSPSHTVWTDRCGAGPFSKASGPRRHDAPTIGPQERVMWSADTPIEQGIGVNLGTQPRTSRRRGREGRGTCWHRGDRRDGDKDCSFDRHLPCTWSSVWMGARGNGSVRTETWPSGDTRERAALRRRISACS